MQALGSSTRTARMARSSVTRTSRPAMARPAAQRPRQQRASSVLVKAVMEIEGQAQFDKEVLQVRVCA